MSKNGAGKRRIHALHVKAVRAMKEAVEEVIRDHARTGDRVVIWRNGKVVQVPAAQLLPRKPRKR